LAELAGYLAAAVDWLAAHPAAGDASDETADLVHAVRRVAYPAVVRRIQVGDCAVDGCPGAMTAIPRDPTTPRPSATYCDTDPAHEWPVGLWITPMSASDPCHSA
jgi:hypothetical protein